MSIKGVITGDIVYSTSILIEKRAGLLECMSSVLDDIMQYFCSLEGSSSGKHDKKSCPPSEVNIIRKMALTQFNLHYQNEGSRDVSLFASFIFIIHASFSCSYPCPYFWAKMFLAGQISRLALFVVFTMPFKIIVCHEYDYG